jgi:hypothetical protein
MTASCNFRAQDVRTSTISGNRQTGFEFEADTLVLSDTDSLAVLALSARPSSTVFGAASRFPADKNRERDMPSPGQSVGRVQSAVLVIRGGSGNSGHFYCRIDGPRHRGGVYFCQVENRKERQQKKVVLTE